MNPVHEGGPFSSKGHSIKALAGGSFHTIARMAPGKYTEEGGAQQAAAIAEVLNAYEPMQQALQAAEKFIHALPRPDVRKDFSGLLVMEETLKAIRAAIKVRP